MEVKLFCDTRRNVVNMFIPLKAVPHDTTSFMRLGFYETSFTV